MRKLLILCFVLPFFWACSNGGGNAGDNLDGNNTSELGTKPGTHNEQRVDLTTDTATDLADNFCASHKNLQAFSKSFLGVMSVMSNHPLTGSCGGGVSYEKDGTNFTVLATDYCDDAAGRALTANGTVTGTVESGANFTSDVPSFHITGQGIDITMSGHTWDGRYNDMFLSMSMTDNLTGTVVELSDVNIKKGELDIGLMTFADLGKFEFKVIKHFNNELTEGQLFFYGDNGETIIMTAENGSISVVLTESKQDQGTWLDSSCYSE